MVFDISGVDLTDFQQPLAWCDISTAAKDYLASTRISPHVVTYMLHKWRLTHRIIFLLTYI